MNLNREEMLEAAGGMHPSNFHDRMMAIQLRCKGDNEKMHGEMDDLLCEVLRSLGYETGVAVYEAREKWYA